MDRVKQLYNYRSFTRQILHRQEDGDLLRDQAGEIISEPEPFSISASQRAFVEQALAGVSGSGEYEDVDGQRYLCAYRSVRLAGMDALLARVTVVFAILFAIITLVIAKMTA